MLPMGFARKSDFSVHPLCSLCLRGVFCSELISPQRHREHRGCTEKKLDRNFSGKAPPVFEEIKTADVALVLAKLTVRSDR